MIPAKETQRTSVRPGSDRILGDASDLIRNKRIGILTNHTGRLSSGRPLVEAIIESGISHVTALFGPEHGVAGDAPNGSAVDHSTLHGISVYSLYGKIHKPTPEMLRDIDVLVCDIQDVGARFYTFISTVALALEAAAERRVPFVILDRPNPIRGINFEGPVRVPQLRSFVSWMPIPVTHGMTMGELTKLWNGEGWLARGVKANLEVVPMDGWRRSMWYDETGLPWISPSPNMPRLTTALIYPGLCLVEGTSIAEGRGTATPFELIGAPWARTEEILKILSEFSPSGVTFSTEEFTPREIPGVAKDPKFPGARCQGIRITVTDRDSVCPVSLGVSILAAFKRVHPKETELRHRRFDILAGSSLIRKMLDQQAHPKEICATWEDDVRQFGEIRQKYLLYR